MFAALHLDILKTDEELKATKPPEKQQDPRIAAAQIRAESELKKAEMTANAAAEELKLKRDATIAELQEKAKLAEADRQHESQMKAIDYNIKIMEFSAKTNMSLDKIKSELTRDAAKLNLQRDLSSGGKAAEQIVTPASEPAPIAKPGHAFED